MNRMKCLARPLLVSALATAAAHADTFKSVRYDPARNQLVVEMLYQGTNPNHTFHLDWGKCRPLDENQGMSQVVVDVLDDQWNDAATNDYSRTVTFDLSSLPCRPARLTLRTAPRFYYTLTIPGNKATQRSATPLTYSAHPAVCASGRVDRGGSMCTPDVAATPGVEIAIFGQRGYHPADDSRR